MASSLARKYLSQSLVMSKISVVTDADVIAALPIGTTRSEAKVVVAQGIVGTVGAVVVPTREGAHKGTFPRIFGLATCRVTHEGIGIGTREVSTCGGPDTGIEVSTLVVVAGGASSDGKAIVNGVFQKIIAGSSNKGISRAAEVIESDAVARESIVASRDIVEARIFADEDLLAGVDYQAGSVANQDAPRFVVQRIPGEVAEQHITDANGDVVSRCGTTGFTAQGFVEDLGKRSAVLEQESQDEEER